MTIRINSMREARDFLPQMKQARKKLEALPDAKNKPLTFWLTLPPSVNKIYATERNPEPGMRPKRRLTAAARAWKKDAEGIVAMEALANGWKCTQHSKVVVEITAFFPDNGRKHDMNNLHKALADVLEGSIYTNDRMALLRDMDFQVTSGKPQVQLKIYQMEENLK